MSIVVTNDFLKDMLSQLTATGGPLDGASCGVFTNDVSLNSSMALEDLTQSDVAGLVAQSVTWNDAIQRSDGSYDLVGNVCQFNNDPYTDPITLYGYLVYRPASSGVLADLMYAELFDAPVTLSNADRGVDVVPVVRVASTFDYGSASVID